MVERELRIILFSMIILALAYPISASTMTLCSYSILAYDTIHTLPPMRIPNASDVLVVYNMNYLVDDNNNTLNDSEEIAEYYIAAREIPESNICPINTSINEEIERAEYDVVYDTEEEYVHHIKQDIENCIDTNGVRDSIRFIVLIKGIPLKINDSLSNEYNSSRFPGYDYSSVESALTMIFQNLTNHSSHVYNTYRDESFINDASRDDRYFFIDYPIDCKLPGDTLEYKGYVISYLVSRLDGYNASQVIETIDRSVASDMSGQRQWVIDDDPDATGTGSDSMYSANTKLSNLGLSDYVTYNNTNVAILSSSQVNNNPVMGYTHHGVYDSNLGNNFIYNGLIDFPLANGSIMIGWESFNGLSFRDPDSTTHNLIADWIMIGGTGGIGSVYEPGSQAIPFESSLFSSYAMGYTFIESAYFSLRYLDFTPTVAGDPLMQINSYPEIRPQYFISTYIPSYNNNYTINVLSVSPYQNINSSWRIYNNSSIVREGYAQQISDYVSRFVINFTGLAEDDYEVMLIMNLSNGSVETLLFNASTDLPTVVTTSFSENQTLYADDGNLTLYAYVPEDTIEVLVLELDKIARPNVWQFLSVSTGNHSINFTNVSAGPHIITMINTEQDLTYQIYNYNIFVVTNISQSRMISQFNNSLFGNLRNLIIHNADNLSTNEGNMSLSLDVWSNNLSIFVEIPLFEGIYANWASSFIVITNLSDNNVTNAENYLGLDFASVALVRNVSSFLNESYFLNGAKITFPQINGTFPVYIENDNGTPVHRMSLCEYGSPNGTINLSNMCYLNTTENITLYLPHFSGGGLANDSLSPNITFNIENTTFNNSRIWINFSVYEHSPSNMSNFCTANISSIDTNSSLSSDVAFQDFLEEDENNYSVSVMFEPLEDDVYNLSIFCTDEFYNNGTQYLTIEINDSIYPEIEYIYGSSPLSDYDSVDYTIYVNTSEITDCRYSFTSKNYSESTYLFSENSAVHQKSFTSTASESITYYIVCADANSLESSISSITLDIEVLRRRGGGGGGSSSNYVPLAASVNNSTNVLISNNTLPQDIMPSSVSSQGNIADSIIDSSNNSSDVKKNFGISNVEDHDIGSSYRKDLNFMDFGSFKLYDWIAIMVSVLIIIVLAIVVFMHHRNSRNIRE